eukprot:CAMPEP_0118655432 /NCGR_PEP_ID=MMETSP0785-20121206/12922_1 /TAXON_ID=91992 /ORGANISM="Bolidomonas pacifica, Strain CCMP 1866" /LENGTH=115 /DNA_ID=CAMNT_0006548163 /DNA_START=42 /DNA_END=389 /DNA_ORIENTATION=+
MTVLTPALCSLSNKLIPSPSSFATSQLMLGGSWHWSPTSTICWHPCMIGTSVLSSWAWLASSMSTHWKGNLLKKPALPPMQVPQTTSASFTAFSLLTYCAFLASLSFMPLSLAIL